VTLDPRPGEIHPGTAQPPAPSHAGEAAEAEVAQLVVEVDGRIERIFVLTGAVVTIGRTPGNSLPLQHEAVSRLHAELRVTPEGLIVTDMGSKNGTLVGAARLAPNQPVRLAPGGVFRIGPYVLRYEVTRAGAAHEAVSEVAEKRSAANADIEPLPAGPPPRVYSPPAPPRERMPMPLPNSGVSKYLDFLPMIFHENDFMSRFLLIFQSIWEPLEQRQDHLAMYFDPRTCPAPFLQWLGGWLGMTGVGPRWSEGRLRTLLTEAVELYRWRGTRYGLTRMIEVCTGITPVVAETASNPNVLHIRVAIPPESEIDRETLERLVIANKPAHTAYILDVAA